MLRLFGVSLNTVFLDFGTFSGTHAAELNPSASNPNLVNPIAVNLDTVNLGLIEQAASSLSVYDFTDASQLVARAQHADVVITNKVVLNAKTLAQLPALKLICVAATGTNNIDLAAAKQRGITVCHAKIMLALRSRNTSLLSCCSCFKTFLTTMPILVKVGLSQNHWSQSQISAYIAYPFMNWPVKRSA